VSTALKEVFARFGVEFDRGPLVTGNAAVDAMVGNLQALGSVVAGAALVTGVANFVDEVRQAGTEIDRTSRALGLNARELQVWRGVAAQAGVTAEQLTPAIQSLRRNASAAAIAGGQMGTDFRRLGINVREGHRDLIDTPELLQRVLEGLAEVEDPTTRAAMAMRLMGESGARMGPLLENGAEGVRAMYAEVERLGVLDDEVIEASADLTREQGRLSQAFLALRGRMALLLLPAFTAVTNGVVALVSGFRSLAARTRLLETSFVVLGTLATAAAARTVTAWVAAAAPFVALGAAVLGLILIVEDLWSAINGGDSVIADALSSIEEYAAVGTGAGQTMAIAWEALLAILTSIVQVTAQATAGLVGLVGLVAEAAGADDFAAGAFETATALGEFGERDLATESDGSAEGDAIAARVRANRADRTGMLPGASFLAPDLAERYRAAADVRSGSLPAGFASGGGGTVVRIDTINANGLDEAAATRVVERAVSRAMATENDDTLDALAGGA
jgi:hypothetical protein